MEGRKLLNIMTDHENEKQNVNRWLPPLHGNNEMQPNVQPSYVLVQNPPCFHTAMPAIDPDRPLLIISRPKATYEEYLLINKTKLKSKINFIIQLDLFLFMLLLFSTLFGMIGGYAVPAILTAFIIIIYLAGYTAISWFIGCRKIEKEYHIVNYLYDSDSVISVFSDRIELARQNLKECIQFDEILSVLETTNVLLIMSKDDRCISILAKYMTPLNNQRIKEIVYPRVAPKKRHVKGQLQAYLLQPREIPEFDQNGEILWSFTEEKPKQLSFINFDVILYMIKYLIKLIFHVTSFVLPIGMLWGLNSSAGTGTDNVIFQFIISTIKCYFIILGAIVIFFTAVFIINLRRVNKKKQGINISLTERGLWVSSKINSELLIPWEKLKIIEKGKTLKLGIMINNKPYAVFQVNNLTKLNQGDHFLEILKEKCGFRIGNR